MFLILLFQLVDSRCAVGGQSPNQGLSPKEERPLAARHSLASHQGGEAGMREALSRYKQKRPVEGPFLRTHEGV